MAMNYAKYVSTKRTKQTEPTLGEVEVVNSTGGYVYEVDCWGRLDRFLVLGNEGGSYYASEQKMTLENAKAVLECAKHDIARTVNRIVEISEQARAPKNDSAIFALAMLSTTKEGLEAVNKVCRIGTHIFQYVEAARQFRGFGNGLKKAVANWYLSKNSEDLALQIVKYQQRNGWSHRDLLRLSHPKSETLNPVFHYAVKGTILDGSATPSFIEGFEKAKVAQKDSELIKIIQDYRLPRECVPTNFLNSPDVWEALIPNMGAIALTRNLAKLTAVGLLKPLSKTSKEIAAKLNDQDFLVKGKIHPMGVLLASTTYASGRGVKGSLTWTPVPQVIDALNNAFYLSFKNVVSTNKNWLLGLDVSGSMGVTIGGTHLTCRVASAAMSMITARTEPNYFVHGFSNSFIPLNITPAMRLDEIVRNINNLPFSSTDCSLPMVYALKNKLEVDVFVVYTDSETYAGQIKPVQALREYRQKMGRNAKLIVVGMTANSFTIADPKDSGMLDVVGFDATVPAVMADFAR